MKTECYKVFENRLAAAVNIFFSGSGKELD